MPIDQNTAAECFRAAANARHVRDFARAVSIYESLAASGQSYALVLLAGMYAQGTELPLDLDKAERLLDRAAKMGETEALIQKSRIWLARKDMNRYFQSVRHAANSGLLPSKFQLAVCYLHGAGVERDLAKAMEIMREAANEGHLRAQICVAKRLIGRAVDPVGQAKGVLLGIKATVKGLWLIVTNPSDPRIR
jgi:TPR repeat protein